MNPLRRFGLWLAGETKSRTTAETLPKWQLGKPYRPPTRTLSSKEAIKAGQAGIVFACIRLLADTATSVPLHVFARRGDDWEHVPQHPLQVLLDNPNSRLTRRRIYYRAVQHLQMTGNAIFTKIRVPKSGPPTQLWPINPDLMRPVPDERDFIAHWELTVGGRRIRIETRDVVHLQLENPESPWWGMGPLQAAMLDVELYKGNKQWNLRTVERGAVTPGVLEVPEDLSEESFAALRAQLDERTWGKEDAGREMILGSGMKYHRLSLTGEELGFLESMRFGREEISMIFGVPAPLLTPENATLANVESYDKMFWNNTIVPLNTVIADILTQSLVPDFGNMGDLLIQHDYSAVPAMQDSLRDQSEVAERLVRTGFTPAGVNRLLDLGFEDEEIKPTPEPLQPAFGQLSARGPTSRKAAGDELEVIWRTADQERQAWEQEVAKRVQAVMDEEADLVRATWLRTESEVAVQAAVTSHTPAWQALLTATYVEAGRHFAQREYDRLAPKARKDFDPQQIAVEWAERMAALKVVGISGTTIEALAAIITAGLTPDASGFRLSVDDIAQNLAAELAGNQARAWTIARTEVGAAMNHGHQEGARQAAAEYDLPMVKVWSSSFDDRVRDSHAEIHGQVRELDEPFSNGLQYPGDPDGPAAEVINCRCVVSHRVAR